MLDLMKRLGAATSVLFLVIACATSSGTSAPPDIEIQIAQLPDAGFAVEDRGATSIAFQAMVRNRTADVITLRKVEMKTVGRSPYTLRDDPAVLQESIEPGKEAIAIFTMWSYASGERSKTRKVVWVSGTAYFESAKGGFQRTFTQSFREP
ncbi:MAG TPA: hypothetical protein VMU84_11490 [Thermoanaerobaculia bacterium]|nr:hypothetical protein [Thermoanaerobaculia bacterium]